MTDDAISNNDEQGRPLSERYPDVEVATPEQVAEELAEIHREVFGDAEVRRAE